MPKGPEQKPKRALRLDPVVMDATLIPTMIGVGVVLGYLLGAWAGTYFPARANLLTGAGALYGLAAGLYQAYKILRRILREQKKDKPNPK